MASSSSSELAAGLPVTTRWLVLASVMLLFCLPLFVVLNEDGASASLVIGDRGPPVQNIAVTGAAPRITPPFGRNVSTPTSTESTKLSSSSSGSNSRYPLSTSTTSSASTTARASHSHSRSSANSPIATSTASGSVSQSRLPTGTTATASASSGGVTASVLPETAASTASSTALATPTGTPAASIIAATVPPATSASTATTAANPPAAATSSTTIAAPAPSGWSPPPSEGLRLAVLPPCCVGGGTGAVMVYNAADDKNTTIDLQDGAGFHHLRVWYRTGPPPPGVTFQSNPLVLSWVTCEANLHHFLLETMSAVVVGMGLWGLLPPREHTSRADVWMYGCHPRSYMFPLVTDACHHRRFMPLLNLLPINSPRETQCVGWDDGVERPLDAVTGGQETACYTHAMSVIPIYGNVNGHVDTMRFLARAAACNASILSRLWARPDAVHVLIMDRTARRIVNTEELQRAATRALPSAETIVLRPDVFPTLRQLSLMVCEVDVIVGVHGAGLQWAGLLGEAATPPTRSALLEITTASWGAFYSAGCHNDVSTTARKATALHGTGVHNETTFAAESGGRGPPWAPDVIRKWSDIHVPKEEFVAALGALVEWVANGSTALT